MKVIKKYINLILRIFDVAIIAIAYYTAEVITNENMNFSFDLNVKIVRTILLSVVLYSGMLNITKTYRNITRYENGNDYLVYVFSCFLSYIFVTICSILFSIKFVSIKVNSIAALIIVTTIIGYRVLLRLLLNSGYKNQNIQNNREIINNVLIIGAGDAARTVLRTLKNTMKDSYNIIGLIDDNTYKVNYAISGKKILGTRYDIPEICKQNRIDLILFTISNISSEDRKNILNICQETGCKVRVLPGTADLIESKNLMDNFRDVEIEDLLGRDSVKLDNENIGQLIENKVVLVTGGGGSIGSELCRQIIKYNPNKLVIVDIYENNLYDIEQELRFNNPTANICAIVASVRDKERLNEIFEEHKPYLVFHAAAHKHVPLMEISPIEAIKNNVFGTYNVVNCADEYKTKRFILISTDKAVNPTNIMGATKRLCEMIVQAKNRVSQTEYAAVRFGNVLGSNGSVIPLFKKQIAQGGPVTVTHKDITRFFMTIPEAVSLVLQAMTYAKGGEIFVLDMGEPVKIYDMSVKLIQLSGYEPNVNMQIKITGLRPGEKLYEEILMNEEGLEATKHDKIHVAEPLNMTIEEMEEKLEVLRNLLKNSNNEDKDIIKNTMKQIVPTFKLGEELNKKYIEQIEEKENKKQDVIEQEEKTEIEETDQLKTTVADNLLEKGKKVIMMNNNKDKEEVSA